MEPVGYQRYRHEVEWYSYFYICSCSKVAVCTKEGTPRVMRYYTKKELCRLIEINSLNTFLLPIYTEALKYFPQEERNEP